MDISNLVEIINKKILHECQLSVTRKIKEFITRKPCPYEKYIRSDGKLITRTCKTNPIINEISKQQAKKTCNFAFV